MSGKRTLLEVTDLEVSFSSRRERVKAVNGVSFSIKEGEVFSLVGESGSGKSVTAMSIMQILPEFISSIDNGSIKFEGKELLSQSENGMRRIRGSEIAMIFQEPLTSLNPVIRCGDQITEAMLLHRKISRKEADERAVDLLNKVGIPDPKARFYEYPHQLSGGMRQRVMIAMALSCSPKLLIADEPTTALDVTIQAQILNLLNRLRKEENMSILFITHDLSLVSENSDRVSVMYTGKISESATCSELFRNPRHPYTRSLMRSIPTLESKKMDLQVIPGNVPDPSNTPKGCSFHPRCFLTERLSQATPEDSIKVQNRHALKTCVENDPEMIKYSESHYVRCPFTERDVNDG